MIYYTYAGIANGILYYQCVVCLALLTPDEISSHEHK